MHDEDKGWRLDKFRIEQFELLDSRPMAELVSEMREHYAGTDRARMDDPIGQLHSIGKDDCFGRGVSDAHGSGSASGRPAARAFM